MVIIKWIEIIGVIFWWSVTNFFLYSLGTPEFVEGSMFAKLTAPQFENGLFWVFLFTTFWGLAFIIAIENTTVSMSACAWYFSG